MKIKMLFTEVAEDGTKGQTLKVKRVSNNLGDAILEREEGDDPKQIRRTKLHGLYEIDKKGTNGDKTASISLFAAFGEKTVCVALDGNHAKQALKDKEDELKLFGPSRAELTEGTYYSDGAERMEEKFRRDLGIEELENV